MADTPPERLHTRLRADDLLWLLVAEDGTYLAAWHGQAGRVLLSWTTEAEMEASLARLFERAPDLFVQHRPEQRPFSEVLALARRCGCRLRIDEYVLEEWWTSED
jgi:DNA-binding IclR family transcriptional regulator